MSQLKALKVLNVGGNKLPSTEVDFVIESFPQLTKLPPEMKLTRCSSRIPGLPVKVSTCVVLVLHLTTFCITDAEKARVRAALPNCSTYF